MPDHTHPRSAPCVLSSVSQAEREAVIAAYVWSAEPRRCFRCADGAGPTATVGHIPAGALRACAQCVVELERDRARAAARYGWPYAPGTPPIAARPELSRRAG